MTEELKHPLNARLNDGRILPIESCSCGHCGNEWFMAAYSHEWSPNFCPYCGIKFLRHEIDGESVDYEPSNVIEQLATERDLAQDAADRMASLVLNEPIDWPFHDAAWERAIEKLEHEAE